MPYSKLCQPAFLFPAICIFMIACHDNQSSKTNLIVNGNAELPRYDSIPHGWGNVQGHWISAQGDSISHDCGYTQNGKYLFFAGNDSLGILQQDIDVSSYARSIDAQEQRFFFSGYAESLDQGPNSDQARITVAALDSARTKTLFAYDSDTTRSLNKWLHLTDTFMAPRATRFIRVRMIAIRHVGGDNDGYFDNLELFTAGRTAFFSGWRLYAIIGLFLILTGAAIFRHTRRKRSFPG